MKTSKILFLLAAAAFVSLFLGGTVAQAIGAPNLALAFGTVLFAASFIPRNGYSFAVETPDLTALSTAFGVWGGKILRKHVNALKLGMGFSFYKNVKTPVFMTKLSAQGNPVPYSAADSTGTSAAKFTDRTLTVRQSKWDFDIDPEKFRQKYLNLATPRPPMYEYILDQVGIEYLAAINNSVIGTGVYNASGTTAAAIANGLITILKAEVTATNLTAVTIGAITSSNAVTKVETFAEAAPIWWRENGFVIKCSWATLDAYKKHYRATYGYTFDINSDGKYKLNGMNVVLEPVTWITTDGLLGVVHDALAFGTDGDQIQVASSMRRNIIEVRLMMPVGLEIEDLDCVMVSDNLVA